MRKLVHPSRLAFCVAVAAGALAAFSGGESALGLPPGGAERAASLERRLGSGAEVGLSRETGLVRFVGTAPGRPIPRPPGLGAADPPGAVALAFMDTYGREFGLEGGGSALRVGAVSPGAGGGATVRLRQEIDGVPVLAGEVAVALDSQRNVLSAAGEVEPEGVDTTAAIGAGEARRIATVSTARGHADDPRGLRATEPRLAVYDTRLLGGPGLGVPTLVWRTEVVSPRDPTLRQLVLVDAKLGVVTEAIDLIERGKDRRVCDAEESESRYPCEAPYDREEGDPATGVTDIDAAYEFAGDTYDFFSVRFGRDSLDGEGLPLRSTVRYCVEAEGEEECPYANAFWDGAQMVYGGGFAAADDVVGHELSHGFTQFTSNLFYWFQSGAINESMSDVFGEYMDLTNGAGDDSASARWLVGEDIPGIGAIRDMQDPTAFGDPDRMTSSKYVADPNQVDNGGVHTNSGVNNKAAYLIADGDTFNGKTVTGIGIDKAARVYFEAESGLLTSGSDYADLYDALQQACANSVGGAEGITLADCQEVTDAVDATEMNLQPLNGPAPEAPFCGSGEAPADLFYDDLETPGSGNWTHEALSGEDGWYYPQNPNLYSWFDATYATSGKTNFWGYNLPTTADYAIAQTADVTIPPGAVYLRFNHSYAFEDGKKRYDGGQLEYSTDGGSTWLDAESLFTHNGYNGTIAKKEGNPLENQNAFTAESNGYISSRVDLSTLSGEEVRFRFRIGTDPLIDDYGWFVDDVRIYECEETEPPPDETPPETTIETGPTGLIADPTPTFTFSSNEEPVSFQCQLDGEGFAPCTSPHTTALLADGPHTFEVRATDEAENTDASPAKREFTVDTEAPDPPTLIATEPPSPANENEPEISGEAEPGSTVRLYEAATVGECTEPNLAAEGSAAAFESTGLTATVANDSTTAFRATAEDAAGNVSSCSEPIEYVEDSTAPQTTIDAGPDGETIADPTPTFSFNSSEPGSFECQVDEAGFSACTSPHTTASLADGPHTFEVRATDEADNTDASPAKREFTVDTEAPDPPTLIATDPASPANENEPEISGEAEPGSTVRLYEAATVGECTEPNLAAEGTAAAFESTGLTATVANDSTTAFRATAEDAAGNVSSCSEPIEYVEDSTAPQTTIDAGPAEGETIADPTPTFEFSANEPDATFQCSLDGAPFSSCTSPHTTASLSDGPHTFEVRATDEAENTDASPAKREFTVDTEAPDPPTLTATDPASPANENEPEISGEAEPGSTVRLYEAATVGECTEPNLAAEGSAAAFESTGLTATVANDSTTAFRASAEDPAGNVSSCSEPIEYVEDSTAPQTTIDAGPAEGETIADPTPTLEFSANEPDATFQCSLDGAPFSSCASPHTTASLADGPHTFEVRATDEAENTDASPAKREFTVDTSVPDETPPETTIETGPTSLIADPTPTFTFSSNEEPVSFECQLDGEGFAPCTSPHTTASLADGPHTFEVRATDEAENTDASPAKREFTVDTEAPDPPTLIATDPASPANENEPEISGEAEPGSTVRLYEAATAGECTEPNLAAEGSAASFESPGLQVTVANDSTTAFRASAEDPAGNVSGCSDPIEYVEDSTAPQTTIDAGPAEGGTIADPTPTFEFSANEPDATFQCSLDGAPFSSCASPHTTAPLADGPHTFEVRATDEADNTDASPAKREFTVDTEAPDPPTLIATDPASPANENEPEISGEAEPGSTVRLYEAATAGECTEPNLAAEGSAASFESPGLQVTVANDSTTAFRATAEDAAGNVSSCSNPIEYVEDSTAPQTTIDAGPAEGETIADPTPTFEFSANEPDATFQCSLDGAPFSSCTSPHTTASLPDGPHSFEVKATDEAGNADISPAQREFTVDTSVPDETPPETTIDSGPPALTSSASASFEFSGSDPGGSGVASFQCRLDSAEAVDWEACTSPNGYGALAEGPHLFEVRAIDLAGNVDASPALLEWEVDTTPPQTTIDAGPDGETIADPTPTFSFNSSEPGSFECQVDEAGFSACTSPHTTASLPDGPHSFEVKATDEAGNADISPAQREFTIDTSESEPPPEQQEDPPSETTEPEPAPSPFAPPAILLPVDRTPPSSALFGPKRQIAGRAIAVRTTCDEPCVVRASGRIVLWRPRAGRASAQGRARRVAIGLRRVATRLAAGQTAAVRLRPRTRRAARRLRRLVARGWRARAVVAVRYSDAAGNAGFDRLVINLRGPRRQN